ncbi:hypothetical protein HF521_019150 [Silurus meridionalis]|uniref:Uncharacterized protein n=1 Tax=Silurus meridionalis TaxID=175797 RepID=A0A8T0BK75_SILME|nr:hypothetical protein HF521_019150 [Silurus meridionalis]
MLLLVLLFGSIIFTDGSTEHPERTGLRALVKSATKLDLNQANVILQQYFSSLSAYMNSNITGRVTKIKMV